MRSLVFIVAALSALLTSGCGQRQERVAYFPTNDLPSKFWFIPTNSTLQQLIDKVGKHDRERGSGIARYEWELGGGSAVLVGVEWPYEPSNRIQWISFEKNTNDVHLSP